jgi:hypothetical protein
MTVQTESTDVAKGAWTRNIKIGTLDLPVPNWSVPVFGVIVILYVAFNLLYQPAQTIVTRYQLGKLEEQDQLEAYKHYADTPIMHLHDSVASGTLEAKLFNDACVSVTYRGGIGGTPPTPHFIKKINDIGGAAPGRIGALASPEHHDSMFVATLHASSSDIQTRPVSQANCLNPHPGSFNTSYGTRNGCWVQVWRNFPDGCVHYQWFNSCGNVWDNNPDGTPRVYWTQCRH